MFGAAASVAFIQAVVFGASTCIILGPQSIFVVRQGLLGNSETIIATVCTLCDFKLIILGAVSFGIIVASLPAVIGVAAWSGALFAIGYGWHSFKSVKEKSETISAAAHAGSSLALAHALSGALALSLLNGIAANVLRLAIRSLARFHGPSGPPATAGGSGKRELGR